MNNHHFSKRIFSLLLIALWAGSFVAKADERTISMSVEITERSVNAFIASQDFPDYSGSYNGISYSLSITVPNVTFSNNQARAQFQIRAVSNQFSTVVIPVNVGVSIPVGTFSVNEISFFLSQEFPSIIDDFFAVNPNVPQWLKPIVKSTYQNLNLTAYPGKLIRASNTLIPQNFSLKVNDIQISSSGANAGKLSVSFSILAEGKKPVIRYFAQYFASYQGNPTNIYRYYFYSQDIATKVLRYDVYSLDGDHKDHLSWSGGITFQGNTDIIIVPKDTTDNNQRDITSDRPIQGQITPGIYYVRVMYESPIGLYYRTYLLQLGGTETEGAILGEYEF